MASTNEDVIVLATAGFDDGRLLVLRLLPDRGTIELAWWTRDEAGVTARPPVLEIAAEAPELNALVRLCEQARATGRDRLRDGGPIAMTRLSDGSELAAISAGDHVMLVRRPERDDRIELSAGAVDLLVTDMLPAANTRLATLGFGMVQQQK